MTEAERRRLRNNAIVAFITLVAVTVVTHDETEAGSVSTEEFLETFDQALNIRLSKVDREELAQPLQVLCDVFRQSVRRKKNRFVMERAIDELFDEIDMEFD